MTCNLEIGLMIGYNKRKEGDSVYFSPYILDQNNCKIKVTIQPVCSEDLKTQEVIPPWQTDWTEDYLNNQDFLLYSMKTETGELVALGAYQLLENSIIVRIVYMESQPESNPTITVEKHRRKYTGIGRALIAFGIKLSVDYDFGGDITFEAKTTTLAEHYEKDFGAIQLPSFDKNSAPRFLLSGKAAQVIFSTYLRGE